MSKIQALIIGIFVLALVGGVVAFATFKGGGGEATLPPLTIWGTMPAEQVEAFLGEVRLKVNDTLQVTYVEKSKTTFDRDYTEALAVGQGPDALLVTDDLIFKNRAKITVLPYTAVPERTFRESFLEAGESLMTPAGVLGLPFAADPLVMYWNRDIFASESLREPPKFWSEFPALAEKLTKKTSTGVITRSFVPFGEYQNVPTAKLALSALFYGAGTPIAKLTAQGYESALQDTAVGSNRPAAQDALRFFTDFANPAKPVYTWNRSLPSAFSRFSAGDSALYFGLVSEYAQIARANPNLNYEVALPPQLGGTLRKAAAGNLWVLAVARSAKDQPGAFAGISILTGQPAGQVVASLGTVAAARRDVGAPAGAKVQASVAADTATIMRSWPDPDFTGTDTIFRDMIESVSTGRLTVENAVARAHGTLTNLLSGVR